MSEDFNEHLSAERLQAFIEGDLGGQEQRSVEHHLAECPRCSADLASWRAVFEELGALMSHAPRPDFADRVMAAVEVSERVPLAARLRARVASVLEAVGPRHVSGERLQDFLEGLLPASQTARVWSHVDRCAACAAELHAWRLVLGRLSELERFAPGRGFADDVLSAVRIPTSAALPVPRTSRLTLSWARRLAPQTRRAWAALAGVAFTPAVTIGLVFYAMFSHVGLTPRALGSFVLWKSADLVASAWGSFWVVALQGAQRVDLSSVVDALVGAPVAAVGGALTYSVASALALRILYKNLTGHRRHAHPSHS